MKPLTNHAFAGFVTFRPCFGGFKVLGRNAGKSGHADHRSRRRRPEYSHFGLDRTRGRGLSHHDLYRRRFRARRLQDQPAGSCHSRHQDAAHGRDGDAAQAAPEVRHAGDLPHFQGRGDRRNVRAQNGRRRFHPQTVLAAPSGRARENDSAPLDAEGRQRAEGDRCG